MGRGGRDPARGRGWLSVGEDDTPAMKSVICDTTGEVALEPAGEEFSSGGREPLRSRWGRAAKGEMSRPVLSAKPGAIGEAGFELKGELCPVDRALPQVEPWRLRGGSLEAESFWQACAA